MVLTPASYLKMLLALLPEGLAWPKENGSNLNALMDGLAQEFARVDSKAKGLLREITDPRVANDMLDSWETMLGLPDECTAADETFEQRKNAAYSKLTSSGSINRQFYIDLAASLGFEITITEFRPFRAGRSRAGDPLSNGLWIFVWRVNAPSNTISYFRAGSGLAGEPLAVWGNDTLECVIAKRKPAGTGVFFVYGS